MKVELTPYELKLTLVALDYASTYYDGEESFIDMAELSHNLQSTYGWGTDEGKDKYDKEVEMKMTPSELKYHVEQGQDRFFFTRETMRFFGDTMQNYGVRDGGTIPYHWDDEGNHYSEEPRTIEAWELYRKHPVKHGLQSSAYFDKKTFRRVFKERE